MDKRKTVLVASVVIILIVTLLFADKFIISRVRENLNDMRESMAADAGDADDAGSLFENASGNGGNNTKDSDLDNSAQIDGSEPIEPDDAEILLRDEIISVKGNTPEYDMELRLCQSHDKKTFLRLRYYLDGASVINDIGDNDIPELKDLFEYRDSARGNTESYIIKQALLNPVHLQLYILIYGSCVDEYVQAALYVINIDDVSLKRLMSYPGKYGEMFLNSDKSLMAYSFGDPPHMSQYQEDFLIDIFDCVNGSYIVKSNRTGAGNLIGSNSGNEYLYDYEFISWQTQRTARLKQTISTKNGTEVRSVQYDVIYDIDNDLVLNMNGSIQELPKLEDAATEDSQANTGNPGQTAEGTVDAGAKEGSEAKEDNTPRKSESDQARIIKTFYSYLESEDQYDEAMKLLDQDFVFKMELLKQFGVDSIIKSDIDASGVSMYGQLLKAVKFDTIADEEINDEICTISYYHFFGLNSDSRLHQLMKARMKKSDGVWKIISIEEVQP